MSAIEELLVDVAAGGSLAILGGIFAYLRGLSKSQHQIEKSYTDQLHALDNRLVRIERSQQLFDEIVMKVIPTLIHSPRDPDWPRLKSALMHDDQDPMSYDDAVKARGIIQDEIEKIASEGGKSEGVYYALMKYAVNKIIDDYEQQDTGK